MASPPQSGHTIAHIATDGVGLVNVVAHEQTLFSTDFEDRSRLVDLLQRAIRERSGVGSDVQFRDEGELAAVVEAIPVEWTNDSSMKCDVVFLQPDVDSAEILEELGPRPGIEHRPQAGRAAPEVNA